MLTVQQEQDSQELITALVGRGKGELVSEGHDDTPDGYGRRITFADVVWTKKGWSSSRQNASRSGVFG